MYVIKTFDGKRKICLRKQTAMAHLRDSRFYLEADVKHIDWRKLLSQLVAWSAAIGMAFLIAYQW